MSSSSDWRKAYLLGCVEGIQCQNERADTSQPYLVAAAIDYEQMTAPLHGSITRQIHAMVLHRRRQALGLEPKPVPLSLPGLMSPEELERKELEGGTVLVGRASLKEYVEGLRRGWTGGVEDWDWEKSIAEGLEKDGMFALKIDTELASEELLDPATQSSSDNSPSSTNSLATPPNPSSSLPNSLSFLSRPPPSPITSPAAGLDPSTASPAPIIPASMHIPPYPLPAQPPILLVPFISRLGFKQVPWMITDFFSERYRVQAGADAALALIEAQTRPFTGPAGSSSSMMSTDFGDSSSSSSGSGARAADTDFGRESEKRYKKDFSELPSRMAKARSDYDVKLRVRIQDVRDLADGTRQLSDEEQKSTKPLVTEQDLKDERKKKELRWQGSEEGYEIVRPEKEVAWDEKFEGWLQVFETPPGSTMGGAWKEEENFGSSQA